MRLPSYISLFFLLGTLVLAIPVCSSYAFPPMDHSTEALHLQAKPASHLKLVSRWQLALVN